MRKAAVMLSLLGMVAQGKAESRTFLARFEGAVGVAPVLNVAGPVNPDGTFPNVKLNIRAPVSSAAASWSSKIVLDNSGAAGTGSPSSAK